MQAYHCWEVNLLRIRSSACNAELISSADTISGGMNLTTFGPAGTTNTPSCISAAVTSEAKTELDSDSWTPLNNPKPLTPTEYNSYKIDINMIMNLFFDRFRSDKSILYRRLYQGI